MSSCFDLLRMCDTPKKLIGTFRNLSTAEIKTNTFNVEKFLKSLPEECKRTTDVMILEGFSQLKKRLYSKREITMASMLITYFNCEPHTEEYDVMDSMLSPWLNYKTHEAYDLDNDINVEIVLPK